MNEKRLTTNGLTVPHLIYLTLSLAMVAASIYMTVHFYEAYFPKGLAKTSGLCDISAFWNCDNATLSPLGHIFYVPTAFFGLLIGLMGLIGAVFSSEQMERTNKFFIYINTIGCCILFTYSLVVLGGLCPMCTTYYVLSLGCAYLFFKYSNAKAFPEIKITAVYGVLLLIPSAIMYNYFVKQLGQQQSLGKQYIEQFNKLADVGDPLVESKYKIHMSTDSFESAPIRISVFSDFQCPFCQMVSTQMHDLVKAFKGKINIQYFFYPLDNLCNKHIDRSFHEFACRAAYIAACDPKKFAVIHDEIFDNQKNLSDDYLNKLEKKHDLVGCMANDENRNTIVTYIDYADQYKLKSTPTIIINGKKIEGSISTPYLKEILKSLLPK